MARLVRFFVAGLIWPVLLSAQTAPAGQKATILASGEVLPAGTHDATVETTGGRVFKVRIVVEGARETPGKAAAPGVPAEAVPAAGSPAAPRTGTPASPPPAPQSPQGLPVWLVVVAAVLPTAIVAGVLWYYFRKVQPNRVIAQYGEALDLVRTSQYAAALPKLTEVEGKLPSELRRQARLFVAFVNTQLKNTQEATHLAAALYREDTGDTNAAYLLAWLYLTDKKYESAETILEAMRTGGSLGLKDSARMLSCAKFARGMTAYRNGAIDQAAELFAEVQKLGHFADKIPADLRDRHVALGAKALFDRDGAAARSQFELLEKAARSVTGDAGRQMSAKAKVGLALAAWVDKNAKDAESAIESNLAAAAQLLKPGEPIDLPWPVKAAAAKKTAADRLETLERPVGGAALPQGPAGEATEVKRLRLSLRDIHFLRGMAVLHGWKQLEREAAQKEIPARYKNALGRLACANAHDEEFSHVYLVAGLLMYYLRTDTADRLRGVDLLDRARKIDLREPETMEILQARDRMDETNSDARTRYMDMLDKYVGDETVRLQVRRDLLAHLSRYRRFSGIEKRPDLSGARSLPPTVEEVRNRSELLRMRVTEIIESGDTADAQQLRKMTASVEEESKRLWAQAETVENKQAELVTATGDRLFKD